MNNHGFRHPLTLDNINEVLGPNLTPEKIMSLAGQYAYSEDVMERYADIIDFNIVLKEQKVSEDYIIKNLGTKFDIRTVAMTQDMGESFYDRYKDTLAWIRVAKNPYFSEALFEKFTRYMPIQLFVANKKCSMEFINKHIKHLNIASLAIRQKLDMEFINKHKDEIGMSILCKHQDLSLDFLLENKQILCRKEVSIYQRLGEKGILALKDIIHWGELYKNQIMSTKFLKEHANKINTKVKKFGLTEKIGGDIRVVYHRPVYM